MKFNLPKLPYKYNALEPYIDEQTMIIHHTKHHKTYLDNLNNLIEKENIRFRTVEDILKNIDKINPSIRQGVINNGGGHANHCLYWKIMSPKKTILEGSLKEAIDNTFGSLSNFKQKFIEKSLNLFGSGWVFLISDKNGKISLKRHSFQNSPLSKGFYPIITIDLWEHAYYLKYQNRKADYINAWINVINWEEARKNYESVIHSKIK